MPSCLFVGNFLYSQLPSSTVVCCVCGWLRIKQQLVSGVVVAGNKKTPKKTSRAWKFLFFSAQQMLVANESHRLRLHAHKGNGKCCRCKNGPKFQWMWCAAAYQAVLISSWCGKVPKILSDSNYDQLLLSPCLLVILTLTEQYLWQKKYLTAMTGVQQLFICEWRWLLPILVVCQRNLKEYHFKLFCCSQVSFHLHVF